MTRALSAALLLTCAAASAPAIAQEAQTPTLADVRNGLVGQWSGELQYRDYQSDQWVGIPMAVTVEAVGDGVTLIRRAVFDDGPRRGAVYITSLEMLAADGAGEVSTSFRAGNEPEIGKFQLSLASVSDLEHWTVVASAEGSDDDRPARIRETTTRDGANMTTLKEVDFTDDAEETWLQRNRTVLQRSEPPATP